MQGTIPVFFCLALLPLAAFAHGGGLDANGCHTNRKTGDYHCHQGPRAPVAPRSSAPRPSNPPPSSTSNPPPTSPSGVQGLLEMPPSVAESVSASQVELVLTAKLLLFSLGYDPGGSGGTLTTQTNAAVKNFQKDQSLAQDGKISGALLVRLAEQVARRSRDGG